MQYTHKQYHAYIETSNRVVIDSNIKSFGKWNTSGGSHTTKGVIYPILGDGDFDGTVKFLNNYASVDEASTKFFTLSTRREYTNQFSRLEEKTTEEQKPKRSVANKPKSRRKKLTK